MRGGCRGVHGVQGCLGGSRGFQARSGGSRGFGRKTAQNTKSMASLLRSNIQDFVQEVPVGQGTPFRCLPWPTPPPFQGVGGEKGEVKPPKCPTRQIRVGGCIDTRYVFIYIYITMKFAYIQYCVHFDCTYISCTCLFRLVYAELHVFFGTQYVLTSLNWVPVSSVGGPCMCMCICIAGRCLGAFRRNRLTSVSASVLAFGQQWPQIAGRAVRRAGRESGGQPGIPHATGYS